MIDVVAAVFRDDENRVLIAQRNIKKDHGGFWEFPGGKIEEGESHEDALRREIWEELQTTISVDDFLMTVEHQYTNFKVKLHFYYCTPNGPFDIQEHIDSCWCGLDTIEKLDWAAADYPVLKRLQEIQDAEQLERFWSMTC